MSILMLEINDFVNYVCTFNALFILATSIRYHNSLSSIPFDGKLDLSVQLEFHLMWNFNCVSLED